MVWTDESLAGNLSSYVLMETGTEIELEDGNLVLLEDQKYTKVSSPAPTTWTNV